MKMIVRALVLGLVITGAAASTLSSHASKANATISHQVNSAAAETPWQACGGHCW